MLDTTMVSTFFLDSLGPLLGWWPNGIHLAQPRRPKEISNGKRSEPQIPKVEAKTP